MRKDVKLGMAIGGGLIALLVGYLLFGPPANNNKKGTQLAGGGGQVGSIIDPGEGTGTDGLGAANPDAANQNTGSTGSAPAGGTNGNSADNGDKNAKAGKGGDGPVAGKPDDRAKDPNWSVLKNGKNPGPSAKGNGNAPAKDSTAGADKPKPAGKLDTVVEGQGTPGGRVEQARLYYNPNDAYGGGISTDAVFGKHGDERIARTTGNHTAGASPANEIRDVVTDGGGAAKHGDADGSANDADHAAKAPTATEPGVHVVRAGETLSSIALVAYGSSSYYPHILRANPSVNPKNLKLGTALKLPKLDDVKPAVAKEDPTGASVANVLDGAPIVKEEAKLDPAKQYRVAPRDNLYKIAIRVYGKSSYVDRIYEKNKATIGPDPTRLKLGMVLDLPEAPASAAASPAAGPTKSTVEAGATVDERQPK